MNLAIIIVIPHSLLSITGRVLQCCHLVAFVDLFWWPNSRHRARSYCRRRLLQWLWMLHTVPTSTIENNNNVYGLIINPCRRLIWFCIHFEGSGTVTEWLMLTDSTTGDLSSLILLSLSGAVIICSDYYTNRVGHDDNDNNNNKKFITIMTSFPILHPIDKHK